MLIQFVAQYATWLLAVLGVGLFALLVVFALSYNTARRAPYFIWRQRAAMRARLLAGLIVVVLALGAGVMVTAARSERTPTFEPLPTLVAVATATATPSPSSPPTMATTPAPTATPAGPATAQPTPGGTVTPANTPAPRATPDTPADTPTPTRATQGRLSGIIFAGSLSADNRPANVSSEFSSMSGPIYGFFNYSDMTNGTEWTYVWLRDSVELFRETGPWRWGHAGRAFLYYTPPGGYTPGNYRLSLYLEGQLQEEGRFTIR